MSKRALRAWYRLLAWIGAAPILLACASAQPDPCSPRAAAALDSACAIAVVNAWERTCPTAELDDCPAAVAVLAACDAQIEYHAEQCR
jgi:hypothetical protein